MIRVRLYWPRW